MMSKQWTNKDSPQIWQTRLGNIVTSIPDLSQPNWFPILTEGKLDNLNGAQFAANFDVELGARLHELWTR